MKEIIPIFSSIFVHGDAEHELSGFVSKRLASRSQNKPFLLFQKNLPILETYRVLIVGDYSNTGIAIQIVKDYLIDTYKLNPENIKTACIAFRMIERSDNPDYYCFEVNHDIFFPWGKNN